MKSAQPCWHVERSGNFDDADTPQNMPTIPALSGEAERRYYYWLARRFSGKGAIVEIGPWLGASTAYIAAGIRDSGLPAKVDVFDKFLWRVGAGWESKEVGTRISGESFLDEFKANLGALMDFVDVHQGGINKILWERGPVELLFLDAPKRTPEISRVLTTFGSSMIPGQSVMVWQDFGHFPSYAIPASLSRLWDVIEPVHVVIPGSTVGLRVKQQWSNTQVSEEALDLQRWTPEEIDGVWEQWMSILPEKNRPLFHCGSVMFLHDIGKTQLARERLQGLFDLDDRIVNKKWEHLAKSSLLTRYPILFQDFYRRQGRLEEFYRRYNVENSLTKRIKRGIRHRIGQLSQALKGRT